MNPQLKSINTRLMVLLALLVFGIQMANYLFIRVLGEILPMGNAIMALSIYGCIALFYRCNHLMGRFWSNPWLPIYCGYIAFSFCYGVVRYKTLTSSVFDLWLFAFLPAVLLVRPFSFDVRTFDRILSIGVILGSMGLILAVVLIPETRYDRGTYHFYAAPLAALAAGGGYLMLKHSSRLNVYTLVGFAGTLTNAIGAGVIAAFRGQLLLSVLLVLLFVSIQLRTIRKDFGWKLLGILGVLVAILVGVVLARSSLQEQMYAMLERFSGITDAYEKTGELAQSDARIGEMQYFLQLNSNWRLILGHGVGGLWYDFHGMFGGKTGGAFAGARTMLHLNWIHLLFKIGIVGFGLLVGMLVCHYRQHRMLIKGNYGWWAFLVFYLAWTTYYGDKDLNTRSMIFLFVLLHPWLFMLSNPLSDGRREGHGGRH